MNSVKRYLFVLMVISTTSYAQAYSMGIQLNSSVLNVQQYNNQTYDKTLLIFPFSIYFNNKFCINKNYQIEISPGYFFGGEYFSGFEVGVYLRRNIYNDKIFGAFGLNLHYNLGSGHGITVAEYAPNGIFTNLGLTFGVNFNKNVSFLLSYMKSLNEDYGYSSAFNFENGLTEQYKRYLFSRSLRNRI